MQSSGLTLQPIYHRKDQSSHHGKEEGGERELQKIYRRPPKTSPAYRGSNENIPSSTLFVRVQNSSPGCPNEPPDYVQIQYSMTRSCVRRLELG